MISGSSRVGMGVEVKQLQGFGIYSCVVLGGEGSYCTSAKGTPGICVGAPPLLCTYEWIMTHIPQMLILLRCQPFYSLSLPLPEVISRNIHLCTLGIKNNTRSCWLFRKVSVLKVQSPAVGLSFPPSRGPPELPAHCLCSVLCIRKNLQPGFQWEGNVGTLFYSLNYMVTTIPNHRCLPVYLARPVKLLPLKQVPLGCHCIQILGGTISPYIFYGGDSTYRTYCMNLRC